MEHHVGMLTLTFVTVALLIGAFTRHLLKSTNIPYTVALLLIGIGLALLERYEYLGEVQGHGYIGETSSLISNIDPHLILFLFLTAGIVVLTIIINGSTMRYVLSWVGLDRLPPAKAATVNKANRHIHNDLQQYISQLRSDEFLQTVDWEAIKAEADKDFITTDEEEEVAVEHEDLVVAFHRRLLETERQSYWTQFKEGVLSDHL